MFIGGQSLLECPLLCLSGFDTDDPAEFGGGARSASQELAVLVSFGLVDLTMGVARSSLRHLMMWDECYLH
jgi:hypothetical protein